MQRPQYRVIKEHKASFTEAMIAEKGNHVKVGQEDNKMRGWYWCKDKEGYEAWVPKTHIDISGSDGVFNQPYNSIEHSVKPGELVQYLGDSLGWTECLNKDWRYGWIPSEKLVLV
jgi:hypothetical protein